MKDHLDTKDHQMKEYRNERSSK